MIGLRATRIVPVVLTLALLTSCGADDLLPSDGQAEAGEVRGGSDDADGSTSGDAPADPAVGVGGGGTLIFDGLEIPIDSVVCAMRDEVIDVGTTSATGHRILLGTNSSANPISAQILDPDSLQWFPQNVSGDEAEQDGNTFTGDPTLYFNNSDGRIVEAGFIVQCP